MDERTTDVLVRPCKTCGATDRYSSGDCRPCGIKRSAAYQKKHKEEINAQRKSFREANADLIRQQKAASYARNKASASEKQRQRYVQKRDQILAKNREWTIANWERVRGHKKKWDQSNKDKLNIKTHNYRSRKRANGGRLSTNLVGKLFAIQRGLCACCKKPLGRDYHLDHRMPLALGGENEDHNMQLLRARCNLQKNAKHPIDFMQERGFLL